MRRILIVIVGCLTAGLLLGQAPGGDSANRAAEARAAAEAYLQAFLDVDADAMERLFHDDWRMSALAPGGDYRSISREEYLERVRAAAQRAEPADYTGSVAEVSVSGRVAVAMLEIERDDLAFHECLSMLRTADGWKVVQKTVDVSPK
jgi:hypothetical protein